MAIANISDSIEELCQSLEQSLSEFEPLDAHEDSLAVNIDIFRNDVVPAMESLKAVFTNAEDSVVAASSIYLKENVSDLSSIPADIKESLLQVFLLCGSENSITDIASSIVTETLENCSRTGNFDEISKYVTNMITELRTGDFGKLFGDGCSSIISEASNILTSHLDGLSDAEKEKIIGSEDGKGFFSYDVKEDGAIDKDSIKAISGMEFHEDGSITDKFGITFTGEVTGHIKEEDSDDAAHAIRDFCILLNDLYKGEQGFAFLDEFDRNDLFDAVKLVAAGFEVPEHCTEALEKYGKALQRLYNVEILDKEKIAIAVDKGMEKDNVDGSEDSTDSGFQQAYYDWGNGNANQENEGKNGSKTDEGIDSGSQTDNDNVKVGSATSSHASEKSVESAEAHSHGKSIIWEKTGDKQIDRLIDKRNEYIKNDSLIPTYRYKLGFSYNTMKIVFSAKMKGIEINGKVPTAMDCFLAVNAFTNTNIYESLIIGVFEGISYLFSSVSDSVKDKVSSDSPDLKKAAAQEAKIEQAKELASEKLEGSVVDMAKNISKILEKPEQNRISKEKQDLIRTSSNYYNAVKNILKLYGSEAGVDKVKACVGKAFESLFSNAGVTAKGVARLELLLEARSIFKIDGEKITIDFGDLFKKEDPDKENVSNDEEKDDSYKETENNSGFSRDEPYDTEKELDDAEQFSDQVEADPSASDEEEPQKNFSTDDPDNTDQKDSDDLSQKADKDSADAPENTDSQQDQAEDKAASDLEEESDDKSSADKDSSINDTDQNEGSVGDTGKADADDKTYSDSSSDNKDTDFEPEKKEENQQKKGADQSDKQPKVSKDSVKDISLTKEEKALKNQIEKILSGKVTADSVKNNPDIKNTVADIKNAGNKQNISDSVSKVIASIQKDYGSDIDQNKLKTVCKGFESITKINGTAVKIKNVISRAAAFYKQFDTIGIVSPAARMQMELQDKIADYLKAKIPLGTVKNEIRNCFTKTDGITNTDSFLNIVSNAVTNTIIGFGTRISSGEKAVISRINNVMNSIVSVSKIAKEKICSAIEKSGAVIKLSVAPVGTGIVFSSFDSASIEAAAKVADIKRESITNNDKEDALMTDSIEEKISGNDPEQAENKVFDDGKEAPEDKVSDDEKEDSNDRTSDDGSENPEDKASDDEKEDVKDKVSDDEKEDQENKVSKDEKENPENNLSDDNRESPGDKASDDGKEAPENKAFDDEKEAPEDKVSKDEKENPESKLSDDDREAPEDKVSDDEKEAPEDKVSDDEKEDPENKLSDDGKEAPEDKASSDDRENLGDKASDDEKENLEDKVSDDEKGDPENKVSHDEREDPEDKVSDSDRENSESKVSDDEKEDLKDKISDDTEDPKDKVSDNDMGNQEKDISDDDRGDIDNKTFNDGQENGLDGQQDNISDSFMDEQNNQPVDTEDLPSTDHSFEETDTNLTGNDSLNDLLNENDNKEDQSAGDPEEPNSSVEDDKRKNSDIESSLDSASSPHAVIDADDDGDDAEEKVQKQNLSTDEENETRDMEISDPAAEEGSVSELNASDISLQETVSENDIADSDHTIGSDISQEENIDFQNEKIDLKTDNSTENSIEGAVDAILSYTSEPDVGFSDFLDILLQINGEEMSIEEAYHNEDISNEDLADALADAITADAENILGDANLSEAYGDLLSDLSDMCGNSFTEILCDKMDPMASVDEAVDAAFDSVIEDMSSAFGTIDSQPSFTVMDLAEFEFSIMDSIDNDNIITDGVDAAMQDTSQNMVDTGTDEAFDAMQSLQTSSDFSMDNANNMMGLDYETPDLSMGDYSMQNDSVSQNDMSDSYQAEMSQDLDGNQMMQQIDANNTSNLVVNDSFADNSDLMFAGGNVDMNFDF